MAGAVIFPAANQLCGPAGLQESPLRCCCLRDPVGPLWCRNVNLLWVTSKVVRSTESMQVSHTC